MQDLVPSPSISLKRIKDNNLFDTVLQLTGQCLNIAFEFALDEATQNNKVFSPQNWTKAKASLRDIRQGVKQTVQFMLMSPEGKEIREKLYTGLKMDNECFETRWSAD